MARFRDIKQQSQACYLLLDSAGLRRFWGNKGGPTEEAVELLGEIKDGDPCLLSSGEVVVLRTAFDLWNGTGGVRLSDIFDILDEKTRLMVVELLYAAGNKPEAVDTWLTKWRQALHPVEISATS
jgi:hypothetical protein